MKKLIIIILLLLSMQVYSQIKIGLNIKPEVSFANSNTNWTNCSYGIIANFMIYKWLSINAGIGYQSKNYDLTKLAYTTDHSPTDNYILHTLPMYIMPRINILKFAQFFQFYGTAGATMNTCFYEKTTYVEEISPTETNDKICFYNMLVNVGLGLECNISKFSIFLEPSFNTVITRNSNYIQPYNNTVPLSIGCFYNFKNIK